MLIDRLTGQEREVDIVLVLNIEPTPITIAIECVAKSRKADVTWVEQMKAKHEHLAVDKIILLSEKGFTPRANDLAIANGMVPKFIAKPLETDWSSEIQDILVVTVTTINWEVDFVKLYNKVNSYVMVAEHNTILHFNNNEGIPEITLDEVGHVVLNYSNMSEHLKHSSGEDRFFKCHVDELKPCYIKTETGERFPVSEMVFFFKESRGDKETVRLDHGIYNQSHIAFGKLNTPTAESILLLSQNGENRPTITLSVKGYDPIVVPMG